MCVCVASDTELSRANIPSDEIRSESGAAAMNQSHVTADAAVQLCNSKFADVTSIRVCGHQIYSNILFF